MNYKIIQNKEALLEFIEWLPELEKQECYYISLLARAKYNKIDSNLTADKNQLKRVTATKNRIFDKIRQMECVFGSYTYKDKAINQNNIALYISSNPRDYRKASMHLLKDIVNNLDKIDYVFNPQSMALDSIQVSHSRKIYFDVDVDFKKKANPIKCEAAFKEDILKYLNEDCLTLIRTHGGIHCMVHMDSVGKQFVKNWHQAIVNMGINNEFYTITMNGCDNLLPVIGCNQGTNSFYPYFLK